MTENFLSDTKKQRYFNCNI